MTEAKEIAGAEEQTLEGPPTRLPWMRQYIYSSLAGISFVLLNLLFDSILQNADGSGGYGEVAWGIVSFVTKSLMDHADRFVAYYTR